MAVEKWQVTSDLLSRREAAKYLGIAEQTLAIWKVTDRYSLPVVKVGRLVKYRRTDLDCFLNRSTLTNGKPPQQEETQNPFVPLKIVADQPHTKRKKSSAIVEVLLPGGAKISLDDDSRLDVVARLLVEVEKAQC